MAVKIKGKYYLNLQEQVAKNKCDIKKLKETSPRTDFVIKLTKNPTPNKNDVTADVLHVKQTVDGNIEEFDFKGGQNLIAGANIALAETEDGVVITATTEPVGSVAFADIGGNPRDNLQLRQELDNKMKLTQSGAWGQETNGWLRINNNTGLQIISPLTHEEIWITQDSIRYYPDYRRTDVYRDFYFGDHSGTIAVTSDIPTKTSQLDNDSDFAYSTDIPTKVSELENDSGFITGVSWSEITDKPTFAEVATSGDYDDLQNKPTIPTQYIKSQSASGNTLTWIDESGEQKSWTPQSGEGGITDVRVNGSSVVTEGVANITIPEDAVIMYDLTLNPQTGEVTINSDNFYTKIINYITANSKYPLIYGIVHITGQPDLGVVCKDIAKSNDGLLIKGYATSFGSNFITYGVIEINCNATTQLATYEQVKALTEDAPRLTKVIVDGNDLSIESDQEKVDYSPTYNDLPDKPTIPTKTSDLTNDSGFITGVTPSDIIEALEGSQFISLDENPETEKLQISFDFTDLPEFIEFADDQDIVASWTSDDKPLLELNINNTLKNKINNSLQLPITHTEETLVGVDTAGAQEQIKIGSGLSVVNGALTATGGSEVHLYEHRIKVECQKDNIIYSIIIELVYNTNSPFYTFSDFIYSLSSTDNFPIRSGFVIYKDGETGDVTKGSFIYSGFVNAKSTVTKGFIIQSLYSFIDGVFQVESVSLTIGVDDDVIFHDYVRQII